MSEKSLFNWLNTKMGAEWESERIENCSNKGIPDAVVKVTGKIVFIELKDWQSRDKHPLTIEQRNFLEAFGGCVVIRDQEKNIIVCKGELDPFCNQKIRICPTYFYPCDTWHYLIGGGFPPCDRS